MELCQGRARWGLGKGSAPEGSEHGMGCPGQWAWPALSGFGFGVVLYGAWSWTQSLPTRDVL